MQRHSFLHTALPLHARHIILHIQAKEYIRNRHPSRLRQVEKSNILFQRYKNYRMLVRLRRCCITNDTKTLVQRSLPEN